LSGGVAKTTTTQTVVIANPINLPITFETAVPAFGNFVVLFLLVQTIQVLAINGSARWPN
jgi:ABC-type arginine/histidine transport system permease subunit